MFQILKRNPLAAAIAIIMHLAIILLMIFGLDWWEQPEPKKYKPEVVQARVVDAAKVDAEVKRLQQAEKSRQEKESAARSKEIKRLEDLRQKRKKEEKRVADLKKKRQVQEKAEIKRKADAKRKAEAKKRKAAEAKKRKLAQQKRAEDEMQAAMEAERDASELNRYRGLIQQAVTASWLRPIGIGDGLKCTLRIRMAAGGNVIAAEVVASSGSGAFDRSARAAVLKADPLPVPTGRMFERFRDINFEFAPSGGN